MLQKETEELEKLSKEELINKIHHWKQMYEELNEYVEKTYYDYG